MKKFRYQSLAAIGFLFLFTLDVGLLLFGLLTNTIQLVIAAILLSAFQFIVHDLFARKQSILKNYPFRSRFSNALRKFSPILAKRIFGDELLQRTVTATQNDLIVKRANNIVTEVVRVDLLISEDQDFEGLRHLYNTAPDYATVVDLRVQIGTSQCSKPYTSSILNIGGLNQNVLSNQTILALSEGANMQNFALNTGKGGISPYLIRGGSDLIWQVAQEEFAFRKNNGSFNEKLFQVTATRPYVKMIEIVLPRSEQSIMRRLIGDRVIFFLQKLRDLSEGKPIGIRLFNPNREVMTGICKSMHHTRIQLDFITVDSTVSLSGFDSLSVINASRDSYLESLTTAKKLVDNFGLQTKIIATGQIVSEYDILKSIALGASACYCTIPMILAVNCANGLLKRDSINQRIRVANFHKNSVDATLKLMQLSGYNSLKDVKPEDFYRKINFLEIKNLKQIYFDRPLKDPHLFSGLS